MVLFHKIAQEHTEGCQEYFLNISEQEVRYLKYLCKQFQGFFGEFRCYFFETITWVALSTL